MTTMDLRKGAKQQQHREIRNKKIYKIEKTFSLVEIKRFTISKKRDKRNKTFVCGTSENVCCCFI